MQLNMVKNIYIKSFLRKYERKWKYFTTFGIVMLIILSLKTHRENLYKGKLFFFISMWFLYLVVYIKLVYLNFFINLSERF